MLFLFFYSVMVSVSFFSEGTTISLRCSSSNPASCISLSAFEMFRRVSHNNEARRSIFIDKIFLPCCCSHLNEMNLTMRPDMLPGVCFQMTFHCFCTLCVTRFRKLIVKILCLTKSLNKNHLLIFSMAQFPLAMYSLLYRVQ